MGRLDIKSLELQVRIVIRPLPVASGNLISCSSHSARDFVFCRAEAAIRQSPDRQSVRVLPAGGAELTFWYQRRSSVSRHPNGASARRQDGGGLLRSGRESDARQDGASGILGPSLTPNEASLTAQSAGRRSVSPWTGAELRELPEDRQDREALSRERSKGPLKPLTRYILFRG